MQAEIFNTETGDTTATLIDSTLNLSIVGGVEIAKISGTLTNEISTRGVFSARVTAGSMVIYTAHCLVVNNVDEHAATGQHTVDLITLTALFGDYRVSAIENKSRRNLRLEVSKAIVGWNLPISVNDNVNLGMKSFDTLYDLLTNIKTTTENSTICLFADGFNTLSFDKKLGVAKIDSSMTISVKEVTTFELPITRHIVAYPADNPTGEVIGTLSEFGRTTTATAANRASAQAQVNEWKRTSANQPRYSVTALPCEVNVHALFDFYDAQLQRWISRHIKEVRATGSSITFDTYAV